MTQDEMEAETLRYRAPAVAALESGLFAVFTPGWHAPPVHFVSTLDLRSTILWYTEWNILESKVPRPRVRRGLLELLDLTDEEITAALESHK